MIPMSSKYGRMTIMHFFIISIPLALVRYIPLNPMGLAFVVIFRDKFLYMDSLSIGTTVASVPAT